MSTELGLHLDETDLPLIKSASTSGKQGAIVAIFSITSTMLGSSVLALPWGLTESGLLYGWFIAVFIGLICFYTCLLISKHTTNYTDFADLLTDLYGAWAGKVARCAGALIVIGASISYCVILADDAAGVFNAAQIWIYGSPYFDLSVVRRLTPVVLLIFLLPLSNLREVSLLVSLSSYGFFSVLFVMFTVGVKSFDKGIELNLDVVMQKGPHVQNLAGLLMLAFFIHNLVITIKGNQKIPQNMSRNLGLAYVVTAFCYLFTGSVGHLAYKDEMKQNWLEILEPCDILGTISRVLLIFQILLVYPILVFVIRESLFGLFCTSTPSKFLMVFLSCSVVLIGTSFSIWYPNIGDLLRFFGAISGLIYSYGFPALSHMTILKRNGELGFFSTVGHSCIILIGVCLCALQFVN
ncbi:hypothetical protein P9112_002928 [Eukaryota sp. TZLM1-RC]